MSRSIWMVLVASFALVGCDLANKEDSQFDDARNPFYKQAQQDLDNTNVAAAAEDFESALRANPKLAGAHYQLGVLYGDKLNNPIASIYHFKRFLELVPTSDKTDQVNAWIEKQSQAFAASLPNSPTQSADDYAKLQSTNATLQKQIDDQTHTIAQLQKQLGREGKHHAATTATATVTPPPAAAAESATPALSLGAPPTINPPPATATAATATAVTDASATPATPAVPATPTPPRALPVDLSNPEATATPPAGAAPGTPPAISTAGGRSYKIVSGDSLWKIAHKMYPGDTKNGIDKIKEANKDVLIDGKPLKIGQVLVIPD